MIWLVPLNFLDIFCIFKVQNFKGNRALTWGPSIADWFDRMKSNPGGGIPSITLCDMNPDMMGALGRTTSLSRCWVICGTCPHVQLNESSHKETVNIALLNPAVSGFVSLDNVARASGSFLARYLLGLVTTSSVKANVWGLRFCVPIFFRELVIHVSVSLCSAVLFKYNLLLEIQQIRIPGNIQRFFVFVVGSKPKTQHNKCLHHRCNYTYS